MATAYPSKEEHNEMLRKLCRICAGFLKKFNDIYDKSHSCDEKREFLTQNFQLNVSNDDPEIHPTRFCNLCYLSPTRVDGPVFRHIHTDLDCVTCSFVEKKQKGGRPKKLKRGKKAGGSKTTEGTTGAKELPRETVLNITRKIEEIESASTVSHRLQNPKYKFSEQVKEDFYCPICKDVLFQPVETFYEHYFCGGCFKQAMLSSGIPPPCMQD